MYRTTVTVKNPFNDGIIFVMTSPSYRRCAAEARKAVKQDREWYGEHGTREYRVDFSTTVGYMRVFRRPRWQGGDPMAGWRTEPKIKYQTRYF